MSFRAKISKLAKKARKGYLLEVHVSYPNDLHDLHNDILFMCEKRKVIGAPKLVLNLYDKKKYVIHIVALDQVLKHGLVLDKVHQVIEFDQTAWLASYIKFSTQLRTRAKNNLKKDFFKLMNNSVFRKTMENIRKHRDTNLMMNEKAYLKRVMKLESGTVISKSLIEYEMGKIQVVMNKPIYLGQAILDLSKIIIYEFHYDYMKPKYGANLWLSYMDTNSLVYYIKTDDFYEDITSDIKARFDMSGYNCS